MDCGITINALLPGLILGEPGTRVRDGFVSLPEVDRQRVMAACPMGRPRAPEEVAATIASLCSDAAGYISGVALPVERSRGVK